MPSAFPSWKERTCSSYTIASLYQSPSCTRMLKMHAAGHRALPANTGERYCGPPARLCPAHEQERGVSAAVDANPRVAQVSCCKPGRRLLTNAGQSDTFLTRCDQSVYACEW